MTHARQLAKLAATAATGLALTLLASTAGSAADIVLSGSIKSAAGDKMGGVTVSAKAEGATITTSVFTDAAGTYYFPPLPAGKYRLWTQALSYETAKGTIELGAAKRQDFTLKPAKDFVRQLPG